jgi:hypothetical protein
VMKEMANRHRKRQGVQAKVLEWRGKRFDINNNGVPPTVK